jgi:hypothetical protein
MTTTPFQKMQLDTTLSLAVIATGLMVSWFGSVESAGQQAARIAAEDRVIVSQEEGRYRMTVTAQRPKDFVPATTQASLPVANART